MEAGGHFPYAGPATFMRFPSTREAGQEVTVLGAPLDLGTYHRSGTRHGPRALRELSLLVLGELCAWNHYEGRKVADWGDSWWTPGDLDHAHEQLEKDASAILATGSKLLTLGGDHSLSLPLLRAHARKHGRPLSLLHFDSHTDLWDIWPKPYHGAPFGIALREGLIDPERSLQLGIRASTPASANETPLPYRDADWVIETPVAEIAELIRRTVTGPVYLTFDIDFLDPAYAPGTGTPVVGGPSTQRARRILQSLQDLNVVGADVVELSPPYDSPGQPTALAAASMAFYILELMLQ